MTDYRLAPQLAARLLGLTLAGAGLLMLLATVVVIAFGATPFVVTGTALVVIVGIAVIGTRLTRNTFVVRLTDDGYAVRFVRGAGVRQARWTDVADAVTTEVAGAPCVVLRLKNGGSTTIPVEVVGADREAFVRDVLARLEAHGTGR